MRAGTTATQSGSGHGIGPAVFLHLLTGPFQPLQQFERALPQEWMLPVRQDFGQWRQHKESFGQAGMGEGQSGRLPAKPAKKKQIQIQGPVLMTTGPGIASAAVAGLQRQQQLQEVGRIQP